MNSEMEALHRNGTWTVTDLPPNREPIGFYVDDIVVTGNVLEEVNKVKDFFSTKFCIKDLGKLKYFLGIEVLYTNTGLCLSQRIYLLELLDEYGLTACKPALTPIEAYVDDCHDSEPLNSITEYQRLVSKLIYLTLTRPDISYAVHVLSQYMHPPLKIHMKIAMRLLRCLKKSPCKGVYFNKNDSFYLEAFVDSDWGKKVILRKSVTGFYVFFCGCLVSWQSKKQSTILRSSAEAEFRALASIEGGWSKCNFWNFGAFSSSISSLKSVIGTSGSLWSFAESWVYISSSRVAGAVIQHIHHHRSLYFS
ncbi:uncharacterized mitochondrial protein AtMg00810-like [Rutidosis leptorrhynchoides]|uniref:uncharacterized mitochondrial protein AtMg00810-like n=1 Tax=Rutidosis leptorrhynchoides TaxID=125765 RepID=UPI003A99C5F0